MLIVFQGTPTAHGLPQNLWSFPISMDTCQSVESFVIVDTPMSSGQLKTIARHSVVHPNYRAVINGDGRYDTI